MELLIPVFLTLCICVCSGTFLIRILKIEDVHFFDLAWLGLVPISIISIILSIFSPLTWPQNALIFIPALFGVPFFVQNWKKFFPNNIIFWISAIIFLLFLTIFYTNYIKFGQAYDADLYHLQIVRWLREYGLVPGVGNIHHRLSNTSFLYFITALFPSYYIHNTPAIISAFFSTLLVGWFLFSFRLAKETWQQIYLLFLTPLICSYFPTIANTGLDADYIALSLVVFFTYHLFSIFFTPDCNFENKLKISFLYIAFSFTIKPLAPVAIIFSLSVFFYLLKQKELPLHSFFTILTPSFCMALAWCTANTITSGYPIFPIPFFHFNFDWTMSKEMVDANRIAVRGAARWNQPGYQEALKAGIQYWFPSWFRHIDKKSIVYPFVLGLLFWIYLLFKKYSPKNLILFIFTFTCLAYWFYMAPAARFGEAFFGIFLATSLCSLISQNTFTSFLQTHKKTITSILFLLLISTLIERSIRCWQTPPTIWQAPSWPNKSVQLKTEADGENFPLWRPVEKDQCGNSPLPCTPYDTKNVYQRKKGDLGFGFYTKTKKSKK